MQTFNNDELDGNYSNDELEELNIYIGEKIGVTYDDTSSTLEDNFIYNAF